VEGLAVAPVEVHQGDERVDDVVDGHQVGAPGVGQGHRRDRRQPGEPGQQWEEVVRAVDLVHLAGA
jgi:hypothetical protein